MNDCLMNASGCKFNRFMIFKKAAHYVRWLETRGRSGFTPAYKRNTGHSTNMDRTIFLVKNGGFMNVSSCKFNCP